ncbi:hypothetical protein ABNX05_10920 [Lysinibacillus sp. M3]|uniref:Uncharacterized protein n=1 Tax=Lysinibacillus zambalensis TaxID=3160866 RepID=A0ABV1MSN5_9BACI
MHIFYDDLKEYIINHDEKERLIPYYETLFQLESYPEMKELLTKYENSTYSIDYNEPDEFDEYSNGWLEIYEMNTPVTFTIELDIGQTQGNYCECKPDDEGYDSDKDCCGIDCDVHLPKVSIVKEVRMLDYEFQGYERDLWVLEEKWMTEHEKEILHKKKLEKVSSIEAQIEQLQKELEVVKLELIN